MIIQRLQTTLSDHGSVMDMLRSLSADMQNRFHRVEHFGLLAEATLLDPRFKQWGFFEPGAADEASKGIAAAAAAARGRSARQVDFPPESTGSSAASSEQAVFWMYFDERAAEEISTRNPSADVAAEMRGVLAEPLIPRSEGPLTWWKTRQKVYEGLTAFMKTRLCIVGTSVPSERIFSKTGQIISDRRRRLNPTKVRQLVFLNANLK
ncbi:hypothetical protein LDENG_00102370 [Lucifuga dentata]|nr:hypothetical protein LDENG_00102370 [Lucifuga dentata]